MARSGNPGRIPVQRTYVIWREISQKLASVPPRSRKPYTQMGVQVGCWLTGSYAADCTCRRVLTLCEAGEQNQHDPGRGYTLEGDRRGT